MELLLIKALVAVPAMVLVIASIHRTLKGM